MKAQGYGYTHRSLSLPSLSETVRKLIVSLFALLSCELSVSFASSSLQSGREQGW